MKKVIFKEIENTDKNKIFWLNLKTAVLSGDHSLTIKCMIAWVHNNKDKNMSELEKMLRSENINLHLISSNNKQNGMTTICPFTHKKCGHELLAYIGTKDEANECLNKYSDSYDDNFNKLNNTGLWVKDEYANNPELFASINSDDENSKKIHSGEFLIGFEDVDINLILQNDIEVAERTGKKIVMMKVGIGENNLSVYSFVFEDTFQSISEIGVIMGFDENNDNPINMEDIKNQKTVSVILNNPSTWHF